MKKFISLMLCIILVLALAVTAVSAEETERKIDPRFLEEVGQKTYIVGAPIATAPVIDGVVQENEYSVKAETTLDENYSLQASSPTGADWTIEWANYFVAYDDECLYLAAQVHDPDHTTYGQWADNVKRGDQFAFAIGGMWQDPENIAWDPITAIAARIEFRFFDGNTEEEKAKTGHEDFFEIQDQERDFMNKLVSGAYKDAAEFTKAHKVVNDGTVTTYEVAIKWEALKTVWPHHEDAVQFDLLTFGAYIQDTVNEEIPADQNNGNVMGHRPGIMWWGNSGAEVDAVYDELLSQYSSAARYGSSIGNVIPNMMFFGTQEEYDAYKAEILGIEVPETDAPETDAPETDAPETDAPETDAPATDAPATDAPETDAPADEKGCGSSIAAIGVALVATLGTCTAFVSKKR